MITMSGVSKLIGNTWVDEAVHIPIPSGISDDFKASLKSMADSIIAYNNQFENKQNYATCICTPNYIGCQASYGLNPARNKAIKAIDDREQLKMIIEDLSGQIAVLTKDNEEFADGLIEQEETIEKLKAEIALLKKGTK